MVFLNLMIEIIIIFNNYVSYTFLLLVIKLIYYIPF
jgi:hypothetical protein